ncbi:MAG: TldD/PmbA family protein [Bacilli bacterium]
MNVESFSHKLLEAGKRFGYADMELYHERVKTFGCQLFQGEIDNYKSSEVSGLSFRGVFEGKTGYAFTEKIAEDSIPFLLENARENALIIEDEESEDIYSGSERYREQTYFSNELHQVSIQDQIRLLLDIERLILAYDARVTGTDYCMLKSSEKERTILNSKGLNLKDLQNSLALYISVIVKSEGQTKTGTYVKITRDFYSLHPEDIAKQAAEEALRQLDSQPIRSRTYPVLLRNDMAAALIQTFSPIFSAENTQRGHSRLHDKVGASIGVSALNIVDDPTLPEGIYSRNFDEEGFATQKLQIVENGTLLSLLHNRKTAKKDKTESTGHAHKSSYKGTVTVAPSNLYVEPTARSYEELVSSMEEGVIVTDLAGLHSGANMISGDFSLAAKGYYVKEGQIQSPVNQMTIAGNFYDILHSIQDVGSDLEFTYPLAASGYIGSPSLLIKALSVTVE